MLIKYSNKELDLCARLMRAEAQAEGELGMLMVGNVIVNRAIANCLDFKYKEYNRCNISKKCFRRCQ